MFKHFHSIKFRLIASTLLCVATVTLISNFYLFTYLNKIIDEKSIRIQRMYLTSLQTQMNDYMDSITSLAILCASDRTVEMATRSGQRVTSTTLKAQEQLNSYLTVCSVASYVDKLIAFNEDGLMIHARSQQNGSSSDVSSILSLPLYQQACSEDFNAPYLAALSPSIQSGDTTLAILCPIPNTLGQSGGRFIYMEVQLNLLNNALLPYVGAYNIFLTDSDNNIVSPYLSTLPEFSKLTPDSNGVAYYGGAEYQIDHAPLSLAGLSLYSCYRVDLLEENGVHLLYTLFVVLVTSLLLGGILTVIVSAYIARPVRRLNDRIRRITKNDFSFDPAIENSKDELGEIGHTVNEMTMSIKHLLRQTEEMYVRRKNIEIELLQSQVNPHFLYNTLDTIRWMAVIQQCPGIANTVSSLVNLLKNLAKGTQDKIPLREELALLGDYIAIQNVRYVETFTFVNEIPAELLDLRIIKLTLQPLVENAIFHGIEPTGECGTITLSGHLEGDDLVLTVTDDGAGIPPEKLDTLLTAHHKKNRSSLNGMGVANVHQRLQLTYGKNYGLTVESELGKYTRVSVHIPKEE